MNETQLKDKADKLRQKRIKELNESLKMTKPKHVFEVILKIKRGDFYYRKDVTGIFTDEQISLLKNAKLIRG